MEQLSLFAMVLPPAPPSWDAVVSAFDHERLAWRDMHPSDLGGVLRSRYDQEAVYALYVEVMGERKIARDLLKKAALRRYANALYIAMNGATARRTFEDECKQAIIKVAEAKLRK